MKFTLVEDIIDTELKNSEQKYRSNNTSINKDKLPAIFKLVKFEPNTINLDYGGGKFDNATEYLKELGVTNLIYDPYNRSIDHNNKVLSDISNNNGADSATLSNVLNVIEEENIRIEILNNIKKLLKPGHNLYITVYEGNKSGVGKSTQKDLSYQLNRKTEDYIEEIKSVFNSVERKGKLIIAH